MPNGGNLPKLIKYNNKIKDVTISKFAGVDAGKFGDCYFIKFTEIKEKESELRVDAGKLQDRDYIARYAREKYSYSKDGEFIIKIPKK